MPYWILFIWKVRTAEGSLLKRNVLYTKKLIFCTFLPYLCQFGCTDSGGWLIWTGSSCFNTPLKICMRLACLKPFHRRAWNKKTRHEAAVSKTVQSAPVNSTNLLRPFPLDILHWIPVLKATLNSTLPWIWPIIFAYILVELSSANCTVVVKDQH